MYSDPSNHQGGVAVLGLIIALLVIIFQLGKAGCEKIQEWQCELPKDTIKSEAMPRPSGSN